jgi:hypothetical protein
MTKGQNIESCGSASRPGDAGQAQAPEDCRTPGRWREARNSCHVRQSSAFPRLSVGRAGKKCGVAALAARNSIGEQDSRFPGVIEKVLAGVCGYLRILALICAYWRVMAKNYFYDQEADEAKQKPSMLFNAIQPF